MAVKKIASGGEVPASEVGESSGTHCSYVQQQVEEFIREGIQNCERTIKSYQTQLNAIRIGPTARVTVSNLLSLIKSEECTKETLKRRLAMVEQLQLYRVKKNIKPVIDLEELASFVRTKIDIETICLSQFIQILPVPREEKIAFIFQEGKALALPSVCLLIAIKLHEKREDIDLKFLIKLLKVTAGCPPGRIVELELAVMEGLRFELDWIRITPMAFIPFFILMWGFDTTKQRQAEEIIMTRLLAVKLANLRPSVIGAAATLLAFAPPLSTLKFKQLVLPDFLPIDALAQAYTTMRYVEN